MYARNIVKACGVLCKYNTKTKCMCLPCNHVDVSFHKKGDGNQTSPPVSGTDGGLHRDSMCYNCDRTSCYSIYRPLPDRCNTGTQSLKLIYSVAQTTPVQKDLINLNLIIIDYCPTMSSVMNPFILSYIKDFHPDTDIRVFKNGGYIDYKQYAKMYMFPLKVFYNPYFIANILALVGVTN